jgi:hypothetical protein
LTFDRLIEIRPILEKRKLKRTIKDLGEKFQLHHVHRVPHLTLVYNFRPRASDFERFETLSRLGLSDMRKRGLAYSSPYVTGTPLKILLYGNSKIAKGTLETELNKHPSGFDCLVVVDDGLLVLSPMNPFSILFREDRKPGLVIANGEALFYLLTNLFVGVQRYSSIDLFRTLWNVRNAAIGQEMVSEDR